MPKFKDNIHVYYEPTHARGQVSIDINGASYSMPSYSGNYYVATINSMNLSATGSTYEEALQNVLIPLSQLIPEKEIDPTNLVIRYDVNNIYSYDGIGAELIDLMGNSSASLEGTVGYNSSWPYYLNLDDNNLDYINNDFSIGDFFNIDYSIPNFETGYSLFMLVRLNSEGVIVSESNRPLRLAQDFHYSLIELDGNVLRFNIATPALSNIDYNTYVASGTYNLNEWYVLGITYENRVFKGYVNGEEVVNVNLSNNRYLALDYVNYTYPLFYAMGAYEYRGGGFGSPTDGANMDFGAFYLWSDIAIGQSTIDDLTENLLSRVIINL